ncbi:Vasopressin V1a receptor [Acropora cervicornis]|uniref:Vasopressin V1a receptor n=1 Tax=Acropora cervicornis TaxID=6130 RepID=A0AAD9V5I7_ACRCE|nr:Vasopressin V1a receptor [Acropora cervicornis]
MGDKNATWTVNSPQANNSSQTNSPYHKNSIYVFTPAGNSEKLTLCLIVSTLGITGFLGNCSIFYFLSKIKKRNGTQSNPFVRSLNLYIRSLSLSDLLMCAVGAPLLCINVSSDVFQSGWPCKIARYLQFVFPAATINTLVVTSLEKFLSTRNVLQRPMSTRKVRNIILYAWLLGLLLMMPASAAYDGIRVDLNNSHFTVICKNNENFYPFRLTLIVLPIQYVLPTVFVFFVNINLSITLWNSIKRQSVAIAVKNSFKAQLRAKRIKGTTLLVALTFGFITPFSFFLGNMVYTQIVKPRRDFSTSYMFRYGSGIFVFLSPVINFTIFFSQMNDFRQFLKKTLKIQRSGK